MTEEVDPRLVALGLVPAPPGWREQTLAQIEAAAAAAAAAPPAAPVSSDIANPWAAPSPPETQSPWATPTQADHWATGAPAAPEWSTPTPPPSTDWSTPAPAAPSQPGDLFPGMGRFTGMPPADAPAAPPQTDISRWTTPAAPAAEPTAPPPQPTFTPPASVTPTAPPPPETPIREAPPPLPPLAAERPVFAPAAPAKKEQAKQKAKKEKDKKEQKEKVAVARPAKVAKPKPAPKPRFVLPPSGVLLRGPIVLGYPEKKLQITLEQLGLRINGDDPIDIAWTDVREIKSRRGRVIVRTKGRPVAFGIPVEGISEPTLAGPLARVVKEASGGSLDLAGSSFLELQNATDSLRDRYHDEDDPLIPTVVGLVFVLAGLTISALLPDAIAIATRTPVATGAYLLDNPLAVFDPRIVVASFSAAGMLAAGVVRVAMGKAATAWARGTLRGWHEGASKPIDLARRLLAKVVLSPAVAAALLLGAIVLTLPSARVQTVIDQSGLHLMKEVPFFDENIAWSRVTGIRTVEAPTFQHFEGIAVVFDVANHSPVSTLNSHLRGGTDKQLFETATAWREGRSR